MRGARAGRAKVACGALCGAVQAQRVQRPRCCNRRFEQEAEGTLGAPQSRSITFTKLAFGGGWNTTTVLTRAEKERALDRATQSALTHTRRALSTRLSGYVDPVTRQTAFSGERLRLRRYKHPPHAGTVGRYMNLELAVDPRGRPRRAAAGVGGGAGVPGHVWPRARAQVRAQCRRRAPLRAGDAPKPNGLFARAPQDAGDAPGGPEAAPRAAAASVAAAAAPAGRRRARARGQVRVRRDNSTRIPKQETSAEAADALGTP